MVLANPESGTMKIDRSARTTSVPTRLVAVCLAPEAGGGFEVREVPRRSPADDEIEIAVAAASVNPIDVRRAAGYGRRLLSLVRASRFPMTLGNDFAGTIVAAGKGCVQTFAVGDRVYGVKPVSRDGSHSSHLLVKGAYTRKAPPSGNIHDLAALPYSFVTIWLAAKGARLTRENAKGKKVLLHGAAGGLGTLALQTLSAWGAKATAIAKATDLAACYAAGATEAIDRDQNPFATLRGAFDATLNFATWNDELKLLSCLSQGALGHATTVHPLIQNFDELGWVGGAVQTIKQKKRMRAILPKGSRHYAWVLFKPEAEALSELARLVKQGRLSLPIGIQAPLRDIQAAFDHVRRHRPGRALVIP
jgi:NADPH:quinone reductase-like Zn-dependent oxidoreductase